MSEIIDFQGARKTATLDEAAEAIVFYRDQLTALFATLEQQEVARRELGIVDGWPGVAQRMPQVFAPLQRLIRQRTVEIQRAKIVAGSQAQ